jgi:hypothetical protein
MGKERGFCVVMGQKVRSTGRAARWRETRILYRIPALLLSSGGLRRWEAVLCSGSISRLHVRELRTPSECCSKRRRSTWL